MTVAKPRKKSPARKKPQKRARRIVTLYGSGKLGRRTFLRVSLRRGLVVTVPRLGTFPGMDVGVYGLSFRAPRNQGKRFVKGAAVNGLKVSLEGHEFVVDGRILHAKPYPGRASEFKVGVEFVRIEADDVWFLAGFVVRKKRLGRPMDVQVRLVPGRRRKRKR
jgi:hypothetical protein